MSFSKLCEWFVGKRDVKMWPKGKGFFVGDDQLQCETLPPAPNSYGIFA